MAKFEIQYRSSSAQLEPEIIGTDLDLLCRFANPKTKFLVFNFLEIVDKGMDHHIKNQLKLPNLI